MPCDRRSVAPCHSPNCSRQAPCNDPLSPRSPTNYTSCLGWLVVSASPEPNRSSCLSLLILAKKNFTTQSGDWRQKNLPKTEGKNLKLCFGLKSCRGCWLDDSCGQWSWKINLNHRLKIQASMDILPTYLPPLEMRGKNQASSEKTSRSVVRCLTSKRSR